MEAEMFFFTFGQIETGISVMASGSRFLQADIFSYVVQAEPKLLLRWAEALKAKNKVKFRPKHACYPHRTNE